MAGDLVSAALVLATSLSAGLGACSAPTQAPRPGTCDPFKIVNFSPGSGAVDVLPDVTMAVTFNDFPDPDTVDVSTFQLFTGLFYHTGRYWVDLIGRQALFQPSGPLSLGLGYTVVVEPAIHSLRGCQLEAPSSTSDGMYPSSYSVMFRTIEQQPSPPPVVPPPAFADMVSLFGGHCAGGGCHLYGVIAPTDDAACSDTPAGALSLCARDAHGALVGVPSLQVNRLVRVVPRDSSRSYLLRKLLGAPPVVGHAGRSQNDLSADDLRTIEAWIDAGALP